MPLIFASVFESRVEKLDTHLAVIEISCNILDLGAGFLSEHLDPSFRTPGEVKEFLEMPLLAAIPKNGH